jgi:protein O-GlcNAc transferase
MNAPITNQSEAIAEYNHAVALHGAGRPEAAIGHYQRAVHLSPDLIEAHFNLGNAYCATGRPRLAIEAFEKLLKRNPRYAKAAYNLGTLLKSLGLNDQALTAYRQALAAKPDYAEALNNIGVILRDSDRFEEALDCFQQALSFKPDLALAYYNSGVTWQKKGQYERGLDHYRKALACDPKFAPARWLSLLSLPMLYNTAIEIDDRREKFAANLKELIDSVALESAADRRYALQGIASTTNFFLQYQGRNDLELQKQYGRFVTEVMAANFPEYTRALAMPALDTGEKIRIGYVSSLMYAHTIGIFLLGWVQHHDLDAFEIHCYHLGEKADALTRRLAQTAHHFHHFPSDIQSAARQIASDNLHLLVHTDIGMNPVTLQLAALRLAPVQCKGWGHPVTTGLPSIDYYLSSDLMEPDDAAGHYSEQLIRLPNLALCYAPPEMPVEPKPRTGFKIPENCFVYLSPQSVYKYLPQHDEIYPLIAQRVPHAKFVFIQNASEDVNAGFQARLFESFSRSGLDGACYCHFVPRMNHADFMSLNLASDVVLDTLDWSGGKTTLEALSCGLPVVTCPGSMLRGRHALAMLKMVDSTATIAKSRAEYCDIAVRLAIEPGFYRQVRSRIQKNRQRLYLDRQFMSALEDFYRTVVTDRLRVASPPKATATGDSGAIALFNRAVAFHQQENFHQAVQFYRQALTQKPRWPEAIFNLARALQALNDLPGARSLFVELLQIDPQNAKALFSLGTLELARNNGESACRWLEQAQSLMPLNALVYNNLGKAYQLRGLNDKAERHFQHAVELDPEQPEAWFNIAEALARQDRLEEAVDCFRKAIAKQPGMSAAYNNMGNVLRKLKRFPEAIQAFQAVVEQEPQLAEGHFNLGSACLDHEQYEQALRHLNEAVRLKPEYADAWNNLALTYKQMGDFKRACAYFDRALTIDPDLAIAHWNRSFVRLLLGDWSGGWQDFEWRFQIPKWRTLYPHRMPGIKWDGRAMPNQTLLVHDEQGLGDTFQFVRYLPWVKARCGRVILETRPELMNLLQGLAGVDELIARSADGPPRVAFDRYIPLMSLPRLFNTTPESVTFTAPYISAPINRIDSWRNRLSDGRFKVGLVWAGRPEHANDANRSCSLRQLAALFGLDRIQFIGLQKGPAAKEADNFHDQPNFINIGAELDDFADTAAVIMHLDLVLTVDTSVAHLAGAMGRPVWVMLPYIPDWRWMATGSATPWYPTMQLFRHRAPKNWPSIVEEIKARLI